MLSPPVQNWSESSSPGTPEGKTHSGTNVVPAVLQATQERGPSQVVRGQTPCMVLTLADGNPSMA